MKREQEMLDLSRTKRLTITQMKLKKKTNKQDFQDGLDQVPSLILALRDTRNLRRE